MFAQCEAEFQSALAAVVHRDRAAVECHGVADDGQPEPRAAELARAALVNAVKALEQVGQVLLVDADAVVGKQDRALLVGVVLEPDEDVAPARVGRGVVREVAEDRGQQRGAPLDRHAVREVDVDAQPLFDGPQLHVGRDVGDQVVQHDGFAADQLAALVHARDGPHVRQQAAQPLGLRGALFEKVRAACGVEPGVGEQRLQVAADRRHGGLQLVVDVVGQLFLDADLLLLLVQGQGVFAVAVGGRLLQRGVEAHDVVRDVAQLVVREGLLDVDLFAALGPFGKFVQARDVVAEAPRGEVGRDAHQQRDGQHEPEKLAVGGEHLAQRHRIGDGRADDAALAAHGRVEVVAAGACRVAADRVAGAVVQRADDLGTVEMVCGRERVERRVEEHAAREVDERDAQVAEGLVAAGDEGRRGDAFVEGVEHPQVEELQPGVEPLGLEALFAAVLEEDEAGRQHPREGDEQQEEPPVVGEPTPQSRSHSPAG